MKRRILIAVIMACVSSNVFADGCMSLKNTSWVGKAKFYEFYNKPAVPINVRINQVTANRNQVVFNISGAINGEPLKGIEVCNEQEKNKIFILSLESAHYDLYASTFSPNAKTPNRMTGLSGSINGDHIDGSNESYLAKS